MNQTDAAYFMNSDIKPRVYGKELDPAVYDDWLRALTRHETSVEVARQAIRRMVDHDMPFKVSSFYKAVKGLGTVRIAEQGKPVHVFGILPERHVDRYNDPNEPFPCALVKNFYINTPKYIPNPVKLGEIARYWAERLKGRIIYAPGFGPQGE